MKLQSTPSKSSSDLYGNQQEDGKTEIREKMKYGLILAVIFLLQLAVALVFCNQKAGYHYDEYYSYYSTNKTYGLYPVDRQWKDRAEIISEFVVREDEGFQYGLVKAMQGFDVHPPLYYMILHTVCSFFSETFSKWFGLSLNLLFFGICYFLLVKISNRIFPKRKGMTIMTALLFGFQAGVLSGILFIRMYMLLTLWCMAVVLWHGRFWEKELRMNGKNSIALFLLVFAGFWTHYYFVVFLFFLCAFTCLYEWWGRKNLKQSILYGLVVCTGLGTGGICYPASLRHIFRGYRGTEATGAFFDLSNTRLRLQFFLQLMNESVFGGALWLLLLVLVLLAISVICFPKIVGRKAKDSGNRKNKWRIFLHEKVGYCHLLTASAGYFIVVAKTALLNAEEANRYELPIYGFVVLLMLGAFYFLFEKAGTYPRIAVAGVLILLLFQWNSLRTGNVQFIYEEDGKNVTWAAEHKNAVVVYCYNPVNEWMIWDESEELMQYDKIYFVNLLNEEEIREEELLEAEEIYLYASRMEQAEAVMEQLLEENPMLEEREKIRELLYCDLYHLD